jgi:hypothetical protein
VVTGWEDLDRWGALGFVLAVGASFLIVLTLVVAFLWWLL